MPHTNTTSKLPSLTTTLSGQWYVDSNQSARSDNMNSCDTSPSMLSSFFVSWKHSFRVLSSKRRPPSLALCSNTNAIYYSLNSINHCSLSLLPSGFITYDDMSVVITLNSCFWDGSERISPLGTYEWK
jgi:hypothetical protein